MALVLSVLVLLSTGCAHRAVGKVSKSTPSSSVTIVNESMFDLTYVIVEKKLNEPFYRNKNLRYFGWMMGDRTYVIDNVPVGRYYFVMKVGYKDDIMYYEFGVLPDKPQVLTIVDTNQIFEVGG
jgi:hypothetical protein